MAGEKESKYQRCDECHGSYLIVFECNDKKKRCARCKERFDGKGGDERGKGDKRSIKEGKGRALEEDAPEDMKQLKFAGYADEVKALLGNLERVMVSWRWQFGGQLDSQVWSDAQIKINDLRDALRFG